MVKKAAVKLVPAPPPRSILPVDDFKVDLVPASIDDALDAAEAINKLGQNFVAPEKLHVMAGYNMRVLGDRYHARVAYLRDQMIENGYDITEPITVFAAEIDGVATLVVQDGHHRRDSVIAANATLAAAKKPTIDRIPVIFKDSEPNLVDLNYALLSKNAGEPPAPYEAAIVVKRLVNQKESKKDIARRLTVTTRYVDDLLLLADAPEVIRDAIVDGKISPTTAITELRDYTREDAVKRLQKVLARMEADGQVGKKVTKKALGDVAAVKKPKRASAARADDASPPLSANGVLQEFFNLHLALSQEIENAYMELAFERTVGYAATIQSGPPAVKRTDPKPEILAQGTGATPEFAARASLEDYKRRQIDAEAADL